MNDNDDRWRRIVTAAARPPRLVAERQQALDDALQAGASITEDSVGCSVTELTPDGFLTPAASSPVAMTLDLAQYDDDDGPCVAACRDGAVHSIAVMGEDSAYRGFTAAALAQHVRSSLSLPLTGTGMPAALNLYAASASAFEDPHARGVAALLARCVAALLPVSAPPAEASRSDHPDLAVARASNTVVREATALVQARYRTDRDHAFYRLTQLSVEQQRSIVAVATDIVRDPTAQGDR